MLRIVCFILFAVLALPEAGAQSIPPLERKVSLALNNHRVVDVLTEIGKQAACNFSYNSSLISMEQMISMELKNKTVREVLDYIFKGKLNYKSRGNYIILSKAPEQQKVITGYVQNEKGEKVAGASIYDSRTLASATTDEYGYYEMKIRRSRPVELSVAKSSYQDTIVPLPPLEPGLQNIVLQDQQKDTSFRRIVRDLQSAGDTIGSFLKSAGKWSVEQFTFNKNVENIQDTIYRDFQISLLPFIGTNGKLSGNVISKASFNIVAGYNRGVTTCEFAGLANIDRGDVSLIQTAGFANIVGGSFTGAQFSGFANLNRRKIDAAQFAGFINLNAEKFNGVQFSGFSNINKEFCDGLSFAGFSNIGGGHLNGGQFAGFANVHVGDVKGIQSAGFLNLATGKMEGLQMSGFINFAKDVKGVQLGVFNFADSVQGLSLGIMSFVRKGYHKLEISTDELGYGHLAFRSGLHYFHNIVTAGTEILPDGDTINWTFGYGVGSSIRFSDRIAVNVDFTANQIVYGNLQPFLNQLAKAGLGIDFRITRGLSVFAGVTANAYFTHDDARSMPAADDRRIVYTTDLSPDYSMRSWMGWKLAFRFF